MHALHVMHYYAAIREEGLSVVTLACGIVKKSSPMESDIALMAIKLIMNLTIIIIIVMWRKWN